MNPKFMYGFIGLLVIGFVALVIFGKQNEVPRPGTAQKALSGEHVEKQEYTTDQPPTSGPHASPIAWGVYETEQRDDQMIHNLEHGGIVVTYRPDISQPERDQLIQLLSKPYSDPKFAPTKVIVAPRSMNKARIVVSSWQRSQSFEAYDKQAIINYIKRNLGKSPEPLAQ